MVSLKLEKKKNQMRIWVALPVALIIAMLQTAGLILGDISLTEEIKPL